MSIETTASTMKQGATTALVPKLRFPEFHGAALRSVLLGDVTEECRSRNGNKHSSTLVMGVTKAEGIVPMEARLIAADTARYKLVETDWFAYNPMRLNIGSIARWEGEQEILVSPDYVVFKCISDDETGCAPGYLDQFRRTKAWEEFVTEGGDGSVRVRIYYKDIARIFLSLPPLPEQQKVADCLSSLDDLIAAQGQKVDALKTHKKGLMQQLFPREGETQPRLRFPEFQDAGGWEESSLGQRIKIASGQIDPKQPPYCHAPQIGSENIESHSGSLVNVRSAKEKGVISGNYAFDENDILYSKIRPALNKVAIPAFRGICSADIYPIRPISDILLRGYLFYLLLSPAFLDYAIQNSERGKIPKINREALVSFKTLFPAPDEQQRIASCLRSLDTLITAETQKLEALKTHRKGLMQQLFPSQEEVEE